MTPRKALHYYCINDVVNLHEFLPYTDPTICPRHPCNNGAECRETDENDFQCICKDGFIGRTCDGKKIV